MEKINIAPLLRQKKLVILDGKIYEFSEQIQMALPFMSIIGLKQEQKKLHFWETKASSLFCGSKSISMIIFGMSLIKVNRAKVMQPKLR